jgi:hypothetical protein
MTALQLARAALVKRWQQAATICPQTGPPRREAPGMHVPVARSAVVSRSFGWPPVPGPKPRTPGPYSLARDQSHSAHGWVSLRRASPHARHVCSHVPRASGRSRSAPTRGPGIIHPQTQASSLHSGSAGFAGQTPGQNARLCHDLMVCRCLLRKQQQQFATRNQQACETGTATACSNLQPAIRF